MQKVKERVPGKIRYLEKGMVSDGEDDLTLIRDTNIKYFKKESDTLLADFVVVEPEDTPTQFCRFGIDYLFTEYGSDGWDRVWEIVDDNVAMVRRLANTGIMQLLDDNDYEAIKGHLILRPLNFSDHRYELKDKVYRRLGDIMLVLYILVEDTHLGEQHNVMSAKIQRPQLEAWKVSEDEVWDAALMNTYLLAPPRMYISPQEIFHAPYTRGAFMALGSKMTSLDPADVPTLTTTSQMNGAIALFYPGVMERVAEMFGDDYYVAFTSIHEARLHKVNTMKPIEILRHLKSVNKAFDPTEILSRKVYLYERATGQLRQLEL